MNRPTECDADTIEPPQQQDIRANTDSAITVRHHHKAIAQSECHILGTFMLKQFDQVRLLVVSRRWGTVQSLLWSSGSRVLQDKISRCEPRRFAWPGSTPGRSDCAKTEARFYLGGPENQRTREEIRSSSDPDACLALKSRDRHMRLLRLASTYPAAHAITPPFSPPHRRVRPPALQTGGPKQRESVPRSLAPHAMWPPHGPVPRDAPRLPASATRPPG